MVVVRTKISGNKLARLQEGKAGDYTAVVKFGGLTAAREIWESVRQIIQGDRHESDHDLISGTNDISQHCQEVSTDH